MAPRVVLAQGAIHRRAATCSRNRSGRTPWRLDCGALRYGASTEDPEQPQRSVLYHPS